MTHHFRALLWALAIGLAASSSLILALHAQTSTDEVHITPRSEINAGRSPENASLAGRDSIRVKVNLVLLPVSVTDILNRPVTGLEKDNFKVFEGKRQQDLRTFSSEDTPVSLGVIFDTSGSMSTKIDRAREAVVEFFTAANPQNEFFMIAFADKPEELSDFTSSVDDVQGRLLYTIPRVGRHCWMRFMQVSAK